MLARVEADSSLLFLSSTSTLPFTRSCHVDQYTDGSASYGYESYAYNPSAAKLWRFRVGINDA